MALAGWMRVGQHGWVPALGLAARVAVLPHHEHMREESVRPLRAALDQREVLLGIDTATAAVCRDGSSSWQVVGAGRVSVYGSGQGQVVRYSSGADFITA